MKKLLTLSAALTFMIACGEDTNVSTTPPDNTDAGCLRPDEPVSYEVFFVVDVSGSMSPFLNDVKGELVEFAKGFPEVNRDGRRVRVDYYLIGFVNDVKVYGDGRMTSIIALEAAFEQAISEGSSNYNLINRTFNAEEEENLLDAMAAVLTLGSGADAQLVLAATDADFLEAPAVLSGDIPVMTKYADLRAAYEEAEIRVHAFGKDRLPGLFLNYKEQPPLTELTGSEAYPLEDLTGRGSDVRETLFAIAENAFCN